ncbi:MAG: hypothetical protein K940chlam5_00512 [Candidatus Anoxychlamydiales bacterium]|nr:hypothetical protein [Candidatus Anoxychlamydiales bacterium]
MVNKVYQSCSFSNLINLISWPFQNSKNFVSFTAPTISFIAAQRFLEISYLTSFAIAGSSLFCIGLHQYYKVNTFNKTKEDPRVGKVAKKTLSKDVRSKSDEIAKEKMNSLKSFLALSKESINEIVNGSEVDNKDEKTEQNDRDIQKKTLIELCNYFEITFDDFVKIFEWFPYIDEQYLTERSAALKDLIDKIKLK